MRANPKCVDAVSVALLVEQMSRRLGWSEGIRAHALASALEPVEYGQECVIRTEGDVEMRCPAWPDPCSYVRVLQHGFEIGYWNSEEWRDDPVDVMGAMLGAMARGHAEEEAHTKAGEAAADSGEHSGRQEHESRTPSLKDCLAVGHVQTFVLGTSAQGQKELLSFRLPVQGMTHQQLLDGEHHTVAMARARERELRDVVAFDETSPAARQMRQIAAEDAAQSTTRGPVHILIDIDGGLVQAVTTDMPARVLVLDADTEGSSDAPVWVDGREVCVSRYEIEAQQAALDRSRIDLAFGQADAHPGYERARG
jgi:hypothetical protein